MKIHCLKVVCLALLSAFHYSYADSCENILGQSLQNRKADLLTSLARPLQIIQYRAPVGVNTVQKEMLPNPKPPSKKPTAEIVKIKELNRTYFALFSDSGTMNQALDRITHFICGSGIISNHKLAYPNLELPITQGHDIRGSRVPVFFLVAC